MEEYLHKIWLGLIEYWFLIASVLTTVFMSVMQTAKATGKIDWLESIQCALFSYGMFLVLSWLNIPQEASVLLSAFIGYKGTHKISAWVAKKFGLDDIEEKKKEE